MRTRLSILVFAALSSCLTSGAQEVLVPTSREADALGAPFAEADDREGLLGLAQDHAGRVWAAIREQGMKLEVLEESSWKTITPKGYPSTLRAKGITTLADGSIACLWHDESTDKDHFVTRHIATEDASLAKLNITLREPRLLPLRNGGLLVSHRGREIIRLAKDGAHPEIMVLPEDVFLPPKAQSDGSVPDDYAAVHVVEHEDALWLWCPSLSEMPYRWRLRGLVKLAPGSCSIVSLGKMQKNNEPVSVVTPWRNNHLAIAVAGIGLVSFDVRGNHQEHWHIQENASYIERIFMAGGKWHIVACPRPDEVKVEVSKSLQNHLQLIKKTFYDPEKRTSILFEVGQGKESGLSLLSRTWKLDSMPDFQWWDRPVLSTTDGFWIATRDGAAFFPASIKEPPARLSARQMERMLRINDTHMLILDDLGNTLPRPLAPIKNEPPSKKRIELLKTKSLLVEDGAGCVLGRLADGKLHLWQKYGSWQPLDVPESVQKMHSHVLTSDGMGQAWLWPLEDGPAAVCDLSTGKWDIFREAKTALEERLRDGTRLQIRDWPGFAPFAMISKPKRFAFLRPDGTLHLFDGRKWRQWTMQDVSGSDAKATGGPFFDEKGHLTLSVGYQDYQIVDGNSWKNSGPSPDQRQKLYHSDEALPPPECPVKRVTCTAYDRSGICWLMDDEKRLWKCFRAKAVPVMEPGGEDDPTHGGGFRLYEAHATTSGHTFLRTKFGWEGGDYLVIHPRHTAPQSKVRLIQVIADTAEIEFGEAASHTWQVDDGEWSAAIETRRHVLRGLPPGEHQIKVLALNEELTPASTTATLHISVEAAARDELQRLTDLLGGDDLDASESAARHLRSQGRAIIPVLQEKRKSANERQRWWLDALIQHLER